MGLPSALTNFISPILAKSAGARSTTTTHTNYGTIGDAIFKKAQLDLQMADLTANNEMKKAEMTYNLDMSKANIVNVQNYNTLNMQQARAEADAMKKASKSSSGEKLMAGVSGALSGAATGAAIGNVPGAIIGGVAGGVYAYTEAERGREEGQRAQQTLGTISNAATTLRGMYDAKKAKDNLGTILKETKKAGDTARSLMSNPATANSPEAFAAQQKYESLRAGMGGNMIANNVNPDTAAKIMDIQMKGDNYGAMSTDRKERAAFSMQALSADISANPDKYATPEGQVWAAGQMDQYSRVISDGAHGLDQSGADAVAGQIKASVMRVGNNNGVATMDPGYKQQAIQNTNQFLDQSAPAPAPQPASSRKQINTTPTQGRAIEQQVQPAEPVERAFDTTGGIPMRPGVTMDMMTRQVPADDQAAMFAQPIVGEQKLAKQGAETVKALEKSKPGMVERFYNRVLTPEHGGTYDGSRGTMDVGAETVAGWRDNLANQRLEKDQENIATEAIAEQSTPKEIEKRGTAIEKKHAEITNLIHDPSRISMRDKNVEAEAKNILNAADSTLALKDQIKNLPQNDAIKTAMGKILTEGSLGRKTKDGSSINPSSLFMMVKNVPMAVTAVAGGKFVDAFTGAEMGKGSAFMASAVLSPGEIKATQDTAALISLATAPYVKTSDGNSAVTNQEAEQMKDVFYNNTMSMGSKMDRIDILMTDLKKKATNLGSTSVRGTSDNFKYDTSINKLRQSGQLDINKAGRLYSEQLKGGNKGYQMKVQDYSNQGIHIIKPARE